MPATNIALPGGEEIHVSLLDLRPEIAQRHNLINLLLVNGIGLACLLLLMMSIRLWGVFRALRAKCFSYGHPVRWVERGNFQIHEKSMWQMC
jgi:hypothetical protein